MTRSPLKGNKKGGTLVPPGTNEGRLIGGLFYQFVQR